MKNSTMLMLEPAILIRDPMFIGWHLPGKNDFPKNVKTLRNIIKSYVVLKPQ